MTAAARRAIALVRRAPMFQDRANTVATVVVGGVLAVLAFALLRWTVGHAIWSLPPGADSSLCRAARSEGACWAIVSERVRFMLWGSYPRDEQWRPAMACALFVGLYVASSRRIWWSRSLAACWIAVPVVAVALMRGGVLGLRSVASDFWGGLPLTFGLSTIGFAAASPLAILLALGRRSAWPAIRILSIAYIELVRGVPFITFLFMAAVMFPLFVPQQLTLEKVVRAQIAIVLVVAAYLAEVVRAGLQAVPRGQYEAAASLGLSYWPATLRVVLPQAVRATVPAIVNTFIAVFKDTALVAVIGLVDLLGAAKAVIVDPKWVGFGIEVYLFAAAIYFLFSFAVSAVSRRFETTS